MEKILAWRILPRLMMIMLSISACRDVEWFMILTDPTSLPASLVSLVTAAMSGEFAVWTIQEGKENEVQPTRSDSQVSSKGGPTVTGI